MRRIFIVGAALALMWGLPHLVMTGENTAVDPMTLAAIGFVLLAAFAVGEFGGLLKLPKVTGYIVSGVLLGPYVLNILSLRVAGEMRVFNTLALGLIAVTAGLELDVKALGKVGRTLLSTIVLKILFLLPLVGGAFYLIQTFYPVLPDLSSAVIVPMAILFAVLAIGTSPAIAIAVVSENKSKGRLSDLVLAISVAKDLVVVVCLALAISYARATLSPSDAFDIRALVFLGEELGLSVAAGVLIGVVLILYSKFVRAEALMALLVMVTVAAEASRFFHLELLLVLIAAGFTVRNFSDQEHHLLAPLNRISLPVFVVFFTTAGANVDLAATLAVLPLAFALVVARALAYFLAGRLGGAVGRESQAVRNNAWLTYLPQAGVTLGLVLIAAEALPDIAIPLRQTGMAVVAVNLILGPVLMSIALKRVGEVPGTAQTAPAVQESAVGAAVEASALSTQISAEEVNISVETPPVAAPLTMAEITARVGTQQAAAHASALSEALFKRIPEFVEQTVRPMADKGSRTVLRLLDGENDAAVIENMASLLSETTPQPPEQWESDLTAFLQQASAAVRAAPPLLRVVMDRGLITVASGDAVSLRFRKRLTRVAGFLGLEVGRIREIPFLLIARICLEPRIAKALLSVNTAWYRTHVAALSQLRLGVDGHQDTAAVRASVERLFSSWRVDSENDLRFAVQQGIVAMCDRLAVAGSPGLPRRDLRYSRVADVAPDAEREIRELGIPWRRAIRAAYRTVQVTALNHLTQMRLFTLSWDRLLNPLLLMEKDLLPLLRVVRDRIETLRTKTSGEHQWEDTALTQYLSDANEIFSGEERQRVRRYSAAFRSITRKGPFAAEVSALTAQYPKAAELLSSGIRPEELRGPHEAPLMEIDCAERISLMLGEQYLKKVSPLPAQIGALAAAAEPALREIVHLITYGLETAIRRKDDGVQSRAELVQGALERAASRSAQLDSEILRAIESAKVSVDEILGMLPESLQESMKRRRTSAELMRISAATRVRAALKDALSRGRGWAAEKWSPAARLIGGASKRSVEDWQIHSGQVQLDAVGIRSYCHRRMPAVDQLDIPGGYKEGLTLEPVSDRRMLAARKRVLERLVSAASDAENSANILIVGGRGTGKTTAASEIHFRLPDRGVVRLDGGTLNRGGDLIAAMADELECPADAALIKEKLVRDRSLVIFDDLGKAVLPSAEGIERVTEWLNFIVSTSGVVRWIVTVNLELYPLLLEMGLPFDKVFGQIVRLEPLDWEDIRDVIASRRRLVGIPVRMGRRFGLPDFLIKRLYGTRESRYYSALQSASLGNLRAALLLHLRSLKREGDGLVAREPRRFTLPFLFRLQSEAVAILAVLTRLGAMSESHLCASLALPSEAVSALLLFLTQSGLVVQKNTGYTHTLRVSPHMEDAVNLALAKRGVVQGGNP